MKVFRLIAILVGFVPCIASGQALDPEKDPLKVSNDQPERPLQMPPASSEVKEAFDDFERFQKRGAWERALKALYTIPEDQAVRFVDGLEGFIVPVARKRRDVLRSLPPEGLATYHLFYDDEAKKLLDQADGSDELKTLERIFSAYFLTNVGDNAADRLADLYFEAGRFDRAAECWLAVLRDHPDTDLSPAQITVKAAVALSRAGRTAEVETIRRDLEDRYAEEKVTIGGVSAPAIEQLKRLLVDESSANSPSQKSAGAIENVEKASSQPDLSQPVSASWQLKFSDSVLAGMSTAEQTQWNANPLSGVVPVAVIAGKQLYVNYLGYVFAINLDNGKLIWRSASFHNLEIPASQNQTRMIDTKRFAILASNTHVWTLSRDLKDQNYLAVFQFICRRADNGDVVWRSADLPDYAPYEFVGVPILAEDTLYVIAKTPMNLVQQQGQSLQYVLAIRADDGKLLWKADIGTFRQAQRYYYYGMAENSPQPRLIKIAGAIYADTHAGVLAKLDSETGEVDWGYGYKTEPLESENRFFYYRQPAKISSDSSLPMRLGHGLVVKGAKSERIYALDSDHLKMTWDRPLAKASRVIGVDDRAIYLGGPELSALDRKTRKLLWSTILPGGSSSGTILVRENGIWQITPRGIFEIDPVSGSIRRIFRGDDTGADGGDLYMTDQNLIAITNRTISAYPVATPTTPIAGTLGKRSAVSDKGDE